MRCSCSTALAEALDQIDHLEKELAATRRAYETARDALEPSRVAGHIRLDGVRIGLRDALARITERLALWERAHARGLSAWSPAEQGVLGSLASEIECYARPDTTPAALEHVNAIARVPGAQCACMICGRA